MNSGRQRDDSKGRERFLERVRRSEERRLRGVRRRKKSIWFGFGYFGVVGWMVMVPLVLGLAAGIWLDTLLADRISWTLTGMFVGIGMGLTSAWLWIRREQNEIERERKE